MNGMLRNKWHMTALVLLATACGSGESRTDQIVRDSVTANGAQATRVDLQQMRSDVDSIMSHLRDEVEDLQGEVRDDRIDNWTQLSTNLEETRGEFMESLRTADTAGRDEAHRIRDRTSERLAELEADVARSEIDWTADAQSLQRRVDGHVQRLQSDIAYLQSQLMQHQRTSRSDAGWHDFSRGLDEDNVANWQEELAEIRSEFGQRTTEGHTVRDIASDLGDRVGDLTRDVREHLHAMRWSTLDRVH